MKLLYPLLRKDNRTGFSFPDRLPDQKTVLSPILVLALVLVACATKTAAQNATATWPLTANLSATVSGNLTATDLAIGKGASFVSYASGSYAAKNVNTTSLSNAQGDKDYLELTLTPAANYSLQLTGISSTNSVSQAASPNNAAFQVQYSFSSGFTTPVNAGSATMLTASPVTTSTPLDLPVAPGQTLYLRIYVWGLSAATTEFRIKDLKILGKACPAAAAISYPQAAFCKDPNTTALVSRTGVAGGVFSSLSGLALNSSTGAVDVTSSTAGSYTVSYTVPGGTGCADLVATTTVKINDLPTAFTLTGPDGATGAFCTNGTPATFTLSGSQEGVTYTFNAINPGGNTPPGQNFTVEGVGGTLEFVQTPDGKWSYKVTGTDDATGCTNTMEGLLTAVDGPKITSQPAQEIAVCAGGSPAALSFNLSGANSLNWEVSTNGGASWSAVSGNSTYAVAKASNNNSTTLTISNSTEAMSGNLYRVVYGGPAACPVNYSSGTVLTVLSAPVITSQPVSKAICNNSNLVLSVTAVNAKGYQWYRNGSPLANATGAQYTKVYDAAADAGSYTVVITGQSPCSLVTSAAATVSTTSGTTTWQGPPPGFAASSTGTAWEVASNWSCGVPSSTVDAVIPPDIIDGYPTIKAGVNGEVRNLLINGGGYGGFLTVEGRLAIYGILVNNGGSVDASGGTVAFNGSATQTIPASFFANNTVQNIVIGNNVNLAGPLDLTGALSFGNVNNKSFATAGYLRLKSGATATARVADLTNNQVNTGNTITGNVTVERYLPSYRRYRLLTAPVQGTTINTAWQEGRTWNGQGTEPAGSGTLITGAAQGTATTANGNGFDFWAATSGASVFRYSGSFSTSSNLGASWIGLSSTKLAGFDNNEAYLLFVRGDRTVTGGSGATILKGKGPLKEVASHTVTVNSQSHTLVGNPFAAPLSFPALYKDNSSVIEPYYWIWQASLGSATGGYVLMQPNGSGGYEAVPSIGTTLPEPVISSGEGFFVVPKAAIPLPATLVLRQNHKASASPLATSFRQMDAAPAKLNINLVTDGETEKILLDGALVRFSGAAAAPAPGIAKPVNVAENLSVLQDNNDLIVASSTLPQDGDSLRLRLWNLPEKTYALDIRSSRFGKTGLVATLVDRFTKTEQPLSLADTVTNYPFQLTGEPASQDPRRFSIVFKTEEAAALPLRITGLKAFRKGEAAQVEWSVPDETGIRSYALERATAGVPFQTLATLPAKGEKGVQPYAVPDAKPLTENMYRVRITAVSGETSYSDTVRLRWPAVAAATSVFPNPSTGSSVSLQWQNKAAGHYRISLFNLAGQPVLQQELDHPGGTAIYPLAVGQLAAGAYTLQITEPDGKKGRMKLVITH